MKDDYLGCTKHDFLTQPHSYTRTPRSFRESEGQHLPLYEQVAPWPVFFWAGLVIAVLFALLVLLDGEVWL